MRLPFSQKAVRTHRHHVKANLTASTHLSDARCYVHHRQCLDACEPGDRNCQNVCSHAYSVCRYFRPYLR